jgi:hypothetical protein
MKIIFVFLRSYGIAQSSLVFAYANFLLMAISYVDNFFFFYWSYGITLSSLVFVCNKLVVNGDFIVLFFLIISKTYLKQKSLIRKKKLALDNLLI